MLDPVKPSRLLMRLDAEIAAAPNQLVADCKRAERAGYLARIGKFEESELEINQIRKRYANQEKSIIIIWLNLIEGIGSLSKNFDLNARDKIMRAHVLSVAFDNEEMRALSAAWLAHIHYLRNDFELMSTFVSESLFYSNKDQHSVRARVISALAAVNQFAGKSAYSVELYRKAHMHAATDGDDAMMSAIMHNRAWLQAEDLRFREWQNWHIADEESHALLAAASSGNFDALIGVRNLETSVPMLKAIVLSSQGKYNDALKLYDSYLKDVPNGELAPWGMELLVDEAWCVINININMDDPRVAKISDIDVSNLDLSSLPEDQKFLILSRIYQIHEKLGNISTAQIAYKLASEALLNHKKIQDKISSLFSSCIIDKVV